MTDAVGRHEPPASAIRVTGSATRVRRDRGDREETADASYFAPLVKARYLLLTTFKPRGTPVSAHVQGIVGDGGRAYFRVRSGSGMARRLQQTDGVQVAPCGAVGLWSYGPPLDAAARPLADAEAGQAARELARKYPVRRRSLARLLGLTRRRLVYYELVLRGSIAYTPTPGLARGNVTGARPPAGPRHRLHRDPGQQRRATITVGSTADTLGRLAVPPGTGAPP